MLMRKNESGFSAVEGIIIVVVVGLLGVGGWYVWSKQNADKTANTANNSSNTNENNQDEEEDETADWRLVTSGKGAYSIRIPDGWTITRDITTDLMASTDSEASITLKEGTSAIINDQNGFGTDAPIRFSVDNHEDYHEGYTQSSFDTVDGVKGVRYLYVNQTPPSEEGIGSLALGDKIYVYVFTKGDAKYSVSYLLAKSDTDRLELIEDVVRTLKFK